MNFLQNLRMKINHNWDQFIILTTLTFGCFCDAIIISLQGPFFPAEAEKKGATPTEYGFIFGVYQLSIVFMSPVIGKLVPYISSKILLSGGFLTIGISALAFGTLDLLQDRITFVALASIVRITEGVGAAAVRTSCYTIVAMKIPDGVGKAFALLETFFGVGFIIGPLIGGILYDVGGFRLPFYVCGGVVLLNAVIVCFALPKIESNPKMEKKSLLQFLMHPSILLFSFSVFTSYNYVGFTLVTFEPHIRKLKLSAVFVGMLFAFYGIIYATFAPFWGWLSDKKCNNKLVTLIGSVLVCVGIFIIAPAPFWNIQLNVLISFTFLALLGLAVGAKNVSAFSGTLEDTINRGYPSDLSTSGLISSVITSTKSLGCFVGPSVGGYLLEAIGYRDASMVFLVLEFILVLLIVLSLCIERHKKENCEASKGYSKIPTMEEAIDCNDSTPNCQRRDSHDQTVA